MIKLISETTAMQRLMSAIRTVDQAENFTPGASKSMPVKDRIATIQDLANLVTEMREGRAERVRGQKPAYTSGPFGTFPSDTVNALNTTCKGFQDTYRHLKRLHGEDLAEQLMMHCLTTLFLERCFSVLRSKGVSVLFQANLKAYCISRQ